jgi:Fe-S cluster biogenesis protein NfuA
MSAAKPADSLRERVACVLAEEVAPALEMDGTHLEVLDVTGGVVRIGLSGSCSGCPGTTMAIVTGIEQELRRRVPEVEYVEMVPRV